MITKKPVVHDDTNNVLAPLADGQVLEPSAIPVSTVDGNVLAVEEDGLAVTAESLVSDDAGNRLIVQDGKLMVEPETVNITVVSDDEGNLITAGSDHGAFLARERMQNFVNNLIDDALDDVTIVSRDAGNYLTRGSDDGAYLSEETFTRDVNELIEDAIDEVVIVSKDADNVLTKGDDGGAYLGEATLDTAVDKAVDEKLVEFSSVSKDADNLLRSGSDGGVFADGNDILSNGDINLITINEVDKKIILTRETILKHLVLVSDDDGNLAEVGSDGGVFVGVDSIVAKDDPLLTKDNDGKLMTEFDLVYNPVNGLLKVLGVDGKTVSSVLVPTSTSALRNVQFTVSKPDAEGEAIEGEYYCSLAFKFDAGETWESGEPVLFTTTKDTAASVDVTYELTSTVGSGVFPETVKAMFMGESVEGAVTFGTPTKLEFADGSTLVLTFNSSTGTAINFDAVFTPAIGVNKGAYLRTVWLLADNTILDIYVDVSFLIDIYRAGCGLSITEDRIFSVKFSETSGLKCGDDEGLGVKIESGGGLEVTEDGVGIDEDWFDNRLDDMITSADCVTYTGTQVIKNKSLVFDRTESGPIYIIAQRDYSVAFDDDPLFCIAVEPTGVFNPCELDDDFYKGKNVLAYFLRGIGDTDLSGWYLGVAPSTSGSYGPLLIVSNGSEGVCASTTQTSFVWAEMPLLRSTAFHHDPVITGTFLNSFIQAGDGITVNVTNAANDHKAVVAIDTTWFDNRVNTVVTGRVDDGKLIEGSDSIDVTLSDGKATVEVNEEWLAGQIVDAVRTDTDLITAGNGLTATVTAGGKEISAVAGTGITVNSSGIHVNTTWFDDRVTTVVGNLVDKGAVVGGSASVDVTYSGGKATVAVDEDWLNQYVADNVAYKAGTNIQISGDRVISATNTTYSAGTGITISGTTISINQDWLNANVGGGSVVLSWTRSTPAAGGTSTLPSGGSWNVFMYETRSDTGSGDASQPSSSIHVTAATYAGGTDLATISYGTRSTGRAIAIRA